MKIAVVAVGKAKDAVGEASGEYEARARRCLAFESHEVKEEQYRGKGRRLVVRQHESCEI